MALTTKTPHAKFRSLSMRRPHRGTLAMAVGAIAILALLMVPQAVPSVSAGTVAFRGEEHAGVSGTSLAVAVPADVEENDLLLAQIVFRSPAGLTITEPADWTLLERHDNAGTLGQAIYGRVADAADASGATYTWTFSASRQAVGAIVAYAGVDTPVDLTSLVMATAATGSSSSLSSGGLTTTVDDSTVVAFYAQNAASATLVPAAGLTKRVGHFSVGGSAHLMLADQTQETAAATGNLDASSDKSGDWIAQAIALPPATVEFDLATSSVSEEAGTIDVDVSLSGPVSQTVTVDYAVTGGSATEGSDYSLADGTLTFNPGDETVPISVSVTGDTIYEIAENVQITLSNVQGAVAGNELIHTLTITSEEDPPVMQLADDVTIVEGTGVDKAATFTIVMDRASYTSHAVTVGHVGGTALDAAAGIGDPDDYDASFGVVTVSPGQTSATFTITVLGDDYDEGGDETVDIDITGPTNSAELGTTTTATLTIQDDDTATLTMADIAVAEGASGTTTFTFTPTLSTRSTTAVGFDWETVANTATDGTDFTGVATTASIPPGDLSVDLEVDVVGDHLFEGAETFDVELSAFTGLTPAPGAPLVATATITDDDPASLSISNAQVDPEGGAGTTTTMSFTVTLEHEAYDDVTVQVATAGVTATDEGGDNDYDAYSATLTFPGSDEGSASATAVTQTVSVTVNGDFFDEDDETFHVVLSGATIGTVTDAIGVGTIVDHDTAAITVTHDGIDVAEGGATDSIEIVLGSAPRDKVDLTLTPDGQLTVAPGTLTFTAADFDTPQVVTIEAVDDGVDEDATHSGTISFSVATMDDDYSDAPADLVAAITDDDTAGITVFPESGLETDETGATDTFTIALDSQPTQDVTFSVSTVDTAEVSVSPATLTFTPSNYYQFQTVTLTGVSDGLDDGDQPFTIDLASESDDTNYDAWTSSVTGSNVDVDVVEISAADVIVPEGNTGTTTATFTVSLSVPSTQTVQVDVATQDVEAAAGTDYTAVATTTLSFAPGDETKTVDVTVFGDSAYEDAETFSLLLSNAVLGTISDDTAIGTISNDDAAPSLSVDSPTAAEDAGTITFTVSLSPASGKTVAVDWETTDAGTATAGTDFTAGSGTLTFNTGETSKTVTVTIDDDTVHEGTETIVVLLSNVSPAADASITQATGTGSITDNDAPPQVSIETGKVVTEGDAGTQDVVYAVTVTGSTARTVEVEYTTSDDSATAGSDYTAVSGTLVFLPGGATSQNIVVPVRGDTLDEDDETFDLTLSNEAHATIGNAKATTTVTDNDATTAELSIGDVTQAEGDGANTMTFTVTLDEVSGRDVTVDYATTDDTATAGNDYTTTSGTLTFLAGETSKTIDVEILGNTLEEDDESFTVTLTNAANAGLADTTATGTITDDDPTPSVSVADISALEAGTFAFVIELDVPSGKSVSVDYATSDGTAVDGTDYTGVTGTAVFATGDTQETVTVLVDDDSLDEVDETFTLTLSNVVHATLGDATATATIEDDDGTEPTISVNDESVAEDAGSVTFTITLSGPSGKTITVDYATQAADPETAVAGADYTAGSGTLAFAPSETSKTVVVAIDDDALDEPVEGFELVLSNPANAALADGTAVATITDNDDPPVLDLEPDSTAGEAEGVRTFNLILDAVTSYEVTGTLDISGTSAGGADCTGSTHTVDYVTPGDLTFTIPAGSLQTTFDVTLCSDAMDEPDETLIVLVDTVDMAVEKDGAADATHTIEDDDLPLVTVEATVASADEAGPVDGELTVTVESADPGRDAVTLVYTLSGTATEGTDFTALGTIEVAAGVPTQTLQVPVLVLDDTMYEPTESVVFTIDADAAYTIGTLGSATIDIADDDSQPVFSVADASATEGDAVEFEFTLTGTTTHDVRGDVTLTAGPTDGTGANETDYVLITLTDQLLVPAGATSGSVTVDTRHDLLHEADETFTFLVTNLQNATPSTVTATGTVLNDDVPRVQVEAIDPSLGETGDATAKFLFSVFSTDPARPALPLDVILEGTATDVDDFTLDPPISAIEIPAATAGSNVTVIATVVDDVLDESPESIRLRIAYDDLNYNVTAPGYATATVADDDDMPEILVTGMSVVEGDNGAPVIDFTVQLVDDADGAKAPLASGRVITVDYTTADLTAKAGIDYVAKDGMLTFQPGETSHTVSVTVLPDLIHEPGGEKMKLALSDAVNVAPATTSAEATITDDDLVLVNISGGGDVSEGDAATKDVTFTVSLTRASSVPISVKANTLAGTAVSPGDLTAVTNQLIEFPPGTTSKQLVVKIAGDTVGEDDETFSVDISDVLPTASGVTIGTATTSATILDDDENTLKINDATVTEGASGTTKDMTFTITRSQGTGPVTFDYSISGGTATQGHDYMAPTGGAAGSLEIPSSENTVQLVVPIRGDATPEGPETFEVVISNPSVGHIKKTTGIGTITDDDPMPPPDQDHDGKPDASDNCPSHANEDQADADGDGLGDVCDASPQDGDLGDLDGDGVANKDDLFPDDPLESADSDGDGIGDNSDADDDGDGTVDTADNCPDVKNDDQADLDFDNVGDACDDDIDGDQVLNTDDAFPRDPSESKDADGDGRGDTIDTDDDNDGLSDTAEVAAGTDPLDPDSDGDSILDGAEIDDGFDPLDPLDPPFQPASIDVGLGTDEVVAISWNGSGHPDVYEYWVFRDSAGTPALVAKLRTSISDAYTVKDMGYEGGLVTYYVQAASAPTTPRLDRFEAVASQPVEFEVDLPDVPCADDDEDGLCNDEEAALGTDPSLADSDGDGLLDGAEVEAGHDPLDRLSGPEVQSTPEDGLSTMTIGLIIGGVVVAAAIVAVAVVLIRRK